jgi:hypothetical protein
MYVHYLFCTNVEFRKVALLATFNYNNMVSESRKRVLPQSIQSARLSFHSSELAELVPPPPHPLPPLGPRGETHSLAGGGCGGTNSDEGTDTLLLYVYYNPSTGTQKSTLAAPSL